MIIRVKTESERISESIRFVENQIEELTHQINSLNYIEDVNGKLIYDSSFYSSEKTDLNNQKRQWEIMLDLLTKEVPFSVCEW